MTRPGIEPRSGEHSKLFNNKSNKKRNNTLYSKNFGNYWCHFFLLSQDTGNPVAMA